MSINLLNLQQIPANQYFNICNDPFIKLTTSQLGEDVIFNHLIQHNLPTNINRFYVDVGSFHPRRFSNTWILHKLGWKGLNIDANINAITAFNHERPNDININCGVSVLQTELNYHKFGGDWDAANTLSEDFAHNLQEKHHAPLISVEKIACYPLNDILEKHLPHGVEIDLIDIDIENLDRQILEDFDFQKYRPKVIAIELHDADIYNLSSDKTISLLTRNRYVLKSINLCTFILIDAQFA